MRKITSSLVYILLIVIVFMMPSCLKDATHSQCPHQWQEATCIFPRTCRLCYQIEGEPLGHQFTDVTCTKPKTCTLCEITEGEVLRHIEVINKAIEPTCTTEGLTEGSYCNVCNQVIIPQTIIPTLAHTWANATCTTPKTCSVCGITDGGVKEHSFESGKCKLCGKTDPVYDTLAEFNDLVKIYGTYIFVDSADGVSVNITWENRSNKEIKYMYFRVELYNRVNDLLECDITEKTSANLKQTGPIPYGKGNYYGKNVYTDTAEKHFIPGVISKKEHRNNEDNDWSEIYWDNVWYNSTAYYVKITGIQIDYMDGTSYTMLDKSVFDSLGIINLTLNDSIYDY